jgi:hypothetical protein
VFLLLQYYLSSYDTTADYCVQLEARVAVLQEQLACKDLLLAAKDGELQALRALTKREGQLEKLLVDNQSVQVAYGSTHVTPDADKTGIASVTEHLKRTCVGEKTLSPLDNEDTLDLVFDFLGIGEYLYAAGVSRGWRASYIRLCYDMAAEDDDSEDLLWTSDICAIMTAAGLQLALESHLTVQDLYEHEDLAEELVLYSLEPIEVLVLLKTYDMPWPEEIACCAAYYSKLQLLQWLHERQCLCSQCDQSSILIAAATNGSDDVLNWLHSISDEWSAYEMTEMLFLAGWHDRLEVVQWLREIGAAWPTTYYSALHELCTPRVAQWVLANYD